MELFLTFALPKGRIYLVLCTQTGSLVSVFHLDPASAGAGNLRFVAFHVYEHGLFLQLNNMGFRMPTSLDAYFTKEVCEELWDL